MEFNFFALILFISVCILLGMFDSLLKVPWSRGLPISKLWASVLHFLSPTAIVHLQEKDRLRPRTAADFLRCCRFTKWMVFINFMIFVVTTDRSGNILEGVISRWGFSWSTLTSRPVEALLLSPFLHWNYFHLLSNVVITLLFVGGLEYVTNTRLAAASYFSGLALANGITSVFLFRICCRWFPVCDPAEVDIGASLGIIGCAGAFCRYIRRPILLIAAIGVVSGCNVLVVKGLLPMNHIFSLLIGLLVGSFVPKRETR